MEISLSHALLLLAPLLLLLPLLLLQLLSSRRRKKSNDHPSNGALNGNPKPKPIPSPPGLPIIGHLHLLGTPLHRSLAALAARHGADAGLLLLRFGKKPVVLVSSPAIATECFTAHDVALADRPGLPSRQQLTGDNCPGIGTARYGPLWRSLRRLATVHALCAQRLSLTASARDAEARAMATKLLRLAGASGGFVVVGVKEIAFEFVANSIMAMVAGGGRRMGEEEVRRFRDMTEAGLAAAGAANRQDFVPLLRKMDFGRTASRLAALAEERREFGQRLVDEYRSGRNAIAGDDDETMKSPAPRTVIGDLLREQQRAPEECSDVVIRTVCLSLLQAGTDTSSSTVEWAMALLLNNPTKMAKVTDEIDSVVGASRLLEERDLACLPYLRSVITETLRLYPLTPYLVPHEASSDCVVANGQYVITRGTMLLVDVFSMQRDPATWNDPDNFIPERFADDNDDANRDGHDKGIMLPFGMGRRKCPGEALAWKTVGMALGVMMQCFEWERIGKEKVDMSEGSGLTMPMAVSVMAMCRPRREMDGVLRGL